MQYIYSLDMPNDLTKKHIQVDLQTLAINALTRHRKSATEAIMHDLGNISR